MRSGIVDDLMQMLGSGSRSQVDRGSELSLKMMEGLTPFINYGQRRVFPKMKWSFEG